MTIQVNSDSNVDMDGALTASIEENVNSALARFSDQITRVEVHLSDVNGERFGNYDKRCLLEARVTSRNPVAVTEEAATVEQAVQGATRKMSRLLNSQFGRLEARK
ncbi:MAG: HPF/RaiA family ribosome-associated protein [Bryobacterales bacterium]|nr:HPF/RaiA family ribosome-associated protein [Bryobacterales bacterium]